MAKNNGKKSSKNVTAINSKKSNRKSAKRNFIDASMRIVKKVTGNPRREGTWGHQSFAIIKNGITIEQFVQKGGRLRDLHWDLEHGNVELKKIA